jgi:hypothetical protein
MYLAFQGRRSLWLRHGVVTYVEGMTFPAGRPQRGPAFSFFGSTIKIDPREGHCLGSFVRKLRGEILAAALCG